MAEMKIVVEALLDLPMEIKENNKDVIVGSGYMAPSVVNPFYEALGLYDLGSSQAVQQFCSQLNGLIEFTNWGLVDAERLENKYNATQNCYVHKRFQRLQREIMEAYGKAIHDLAVKKGEKMAESLGIMDADFEEWPCQFRINKYNFTPEAVRSLGVQLHTDSRFLTILQDDENVGGLEVMDSSGSFVSIPPFHGTLLANLGDIAQEPFQLHWWKFARGPNFEGLHASQRNEILMLSLCEGHVYSPPICLRLKDVDVVHLSFKKGYDNILVNKIAKLKSLSMTDREDNDSDAHEEFTADAPDESSSPSMWMLCYSPQITLFFVLLGKIVSLFQIRFSSHLFSAKSFSQISCTSSSIFHFLPFFKSLL
ncbi:hypothetical protein P8452_60342 [Trifolium repens]|nr:hypothetical protein P8452_60342 [Trifolium repens]